MTEKGDHSTVGNSKTNESPGQAQDKRVVNAHDPFQPNDDMDFSGAVSHATAFNNPVMAMS